MILHMIVGKLIRSMDAFKGSKPIYDKNGILIVRGLYRDENIYNYNNIKDYIMNKFKENNINLATDEDIVEFLEKIDEKFGGCEIYPDNFGFEILKKSFEDMGCECDYLIGKKGDVYIGVSIWRDKINKKPVFVEIIAC